MPSERPAGSTPSSTTWTVTSWSLRKTSRSLIRSSARAGAATASTIAAAPRCLTSRKPRIRRTAHYIAGIQAERAAQESEVPEEVEDLVPDELIAVAQAGQRAPVAEHDRVVQGASPRQAVFPHEPEVLQEAVGARRREVLDERPLGRRPRQDLRPDRRVLVVERVADAERVRWNDLHPSAVVADPERARNRQRPQPRRLLDAAGEREQRHERLGASVERRDLGPVHLDLEIVDAEPRDGRHQMLDRLDPRAVHADRGRVVRVDDAVGSRRDPLTRGACPEHDARVSGCRTESDPGDLARVEADTFDADRLANRMLSHRP